jgi:hypothetical protein
MPKAPNAVRPASAREKPDPKWLKWLERWLSKGIVQDIREVSAAPRAIVLLLAIGGAGGHAVAAWYYSGRVSDAESRVALRDDQLSAKQSELHAKDERMRKLEEESKANGESLFLRWGGGRAGECEAIVDGKPLLTYAKEYNAVVICGLPRANVDRFADQAIAVSRTFTIDDSGFLAQMPVTAPMRQAARDFAKGTSPPAELKGRRLAVSMMVLYEVALLPKGVESANIKTLADVSKFGGRVLSSRTGTRMAIPVDE